MNLQTLYLKTKKHIEAIDFSLLWKDFKPLKFALYNDSECFFDGEYIEKSEEFLANTSILFQGEYIAIWKVDNELDDVVLTSKIVHEMFHAFQQINCDSRFPNELEALSKYRYMADNLSIKLEENILIAKLIGHFDRNEFENLLALRKYRMLHYEYEFLYEAAVEQIEGTANYVELGVLKQLSKEKFENTLSVILNRIQNPVSLIPVRIISYSIGALFFYILKENSIADFEYFSTQPTAISTLDNKLSYRGTPIVSSKIQAAVDAYNQETNEIITNALTSGYCEDVGEFDLLGVNIYNARYRNRYIVSTFFVMYGIKENPKVLSGDFVIELNEFGKATRIIRIK
ncbi:MAG: hypothetical protein QM644_18840 [Mobilitalea sp.]